MCAGEGEQAKSTGEGRRGREGERQRRTAELGTQKTRAPTGDSMRSENSKTASTLRLVDERDEERRREEREAMLQQKEVSLLSVFMTTNNSRALNSNLYIFYLMDNSISSRCILLRLLVMEIVNA
jgi:hypothetical protein